MQEENWNNGILEGRFRINARYMSYFQYPILQRSNSAIVAGATMAKLAIPSFQEKCKYPLLPCGL